MATGFRSSMAEIASPQPGPVARLLRRLRPRPWRALQVEVTTRCTRSCVVCPRSALAERWRQLDLDAEAWRRITPDLEVFEHVHLQGWGEPLLHPDLRAMAADARHAGCRVGVTTNGDLLAEEAGWIAADGVDLVCVSIAGGPHSSSRLRGGQSLPATWAAVSRLASLRRRARRPRIQVAYLLTTANAPELPSATAAAASAGADELYVIHLDVRPTPELAELAAFGPDGLRPGVEDCLRRAEDTARAARIGFRGPASQPEELLTCALDPTRFVTVSADGSVGPCVNLMMPVAGTIPRVTPDGVVEVPRLVYGDLHRSSLGEILHGPAARAFRAPFAARTAAEQEFLGSIEGHGRAALERLEAADGRRSRRLAEAPFPAPCAGCAKAAGW